MSSVRFQIGGGLLFAAFALTGCGREPGRVSTQPLFPAAAQVAPTPASPAAAAMPAQLGQPLPSLAPLVEQVKAAVVNVEVQSWAHSRQLPPEMDLFGRFFGMAPGMGMEPSQPRQPVRRGAGSGFIISSQGRILTNNHVVDGADLIRVKLDDGRSFDAQVLGRDPLTDLALLQIKGEVSGLPTVALGDSDAVRVGDWVVAIGNPFGLASSVSAGILSARARDIHAGPWDDFLQTDAAINPGNSGGPLFNLRGEVVGVNSAIIGGSTGIGFAVPSSIAKALLPQLEKGEVRRGWLGVGIQDLTPELAKAMNVPAEKGAVVVEVSPGTPAADAELRADDVVVAVDGRPVESSKDLSRQVAFRPPGSSVTLTVLREGTRREVKVELGERADKTHVITRPMNPAQAERDGQSVGFAYQDAQGGAVVTQVEPGSAADEAGLRPGMKIVEAGGHPVADAEDLYQAIRGAKKGSALLLRAEAGDGHALLALPIR